MLRAYVRTSRRTGLGMGPFLTLVVGIVWLTVALIYVVVVGLFRLGVLGYVTLRRARASRAGRASHAPR